MKQTAELTTLPARDRILETAHRLFYRNGITATGIDRVIAEAGVAKMSFYRHFPSKRELALAFLETRHARWMAWFTARVAALSKRGRPPLVAVAAVLKEWFTEPDFRGCAFINTVAGSPEDAGAERQVALRHKEELRAYVASLFADVPAKTANRLSRQALIIIEGAIVRAQMTGDPGVADEAGQLFVLLGSPPVVTARRAPAAHSSAARQR